MFLRRISRQYTGASILALMLRFRRRARTLLLPLWTTKRSMTYGTEPGQWLHVMHARWPFHRSWKVAAVFHGGGWREGGPADMIDRVCRRYLKRGFLVANIGYRCAGVVPASADAVLALEWVANNMTLFRGDPGRLIVTGESAGAHLALLAAFTSRARVRALVNFYGVTDLRLHPSTATDDSLPPGDLERILQNLSPIRFVRPGVCPVLSIHGTADTLVSFDQTSRLTAKLRDAGVEASEIVVPGGGHGFPESRLDAIYHQIFKFLKQHN